MKLKQNKIFPRLAAGFLAGAGGICFSICANAAAARAGVETVTMSATVTVPERAPAKAKAPVVAQQAGMVAAPAEAPVDVPAALQRLVLRIRDKLDAARVPPALQNLTAELAAFDAIVADNRGARPDDLAQVLMVKSQLYVQVLNDFDNAAKTVAQIKADYPQTDIGAHADEMLADLKRMQTKYLAKQTLAPGRVFPDFSAKDLAGEDVSLAQLKGKVVLLDFWATWCPPCVVEMPRLKAAHEKYREKGFVIVGISLDNSESALRDFIKQHGISWAQIFDGKGWESELAEKYGVDMVPTMYLLDAEGKIVGSNHGGMVLEAQLERLLEK
jgi:peroxiredoxin